MRQPTWRRRLVAVVGAFAVSLATGVGAAFVVSGGVASAAVVTGPWTLPALINPANISQNTHGQETCSATPVLTPAVPVQCGAAGSVAISPGTALSGTNGSAELIGAGSGLTFTLRNDWVAGNTLSLTVGPNNTPGGNCTVPNGTQPGVNAVGANSSGSDNGNWVGFSDFTSASTGMDTALPGEPADFIRPSKPPNLESFGARVTPKGTF